LFIALSKSDMEGAGRIPAVWKNLVGGTPTLKEYLAIRTSQEDHPRPVKNLVSMSL
jgi:Asp-tRNA(Asn)/Glu-tRNA(Gln) amidotransferase A subunit family amidase